MEERAIVESKNKEVKTLGKNLGYTYKILDPYVCELQVEIDHEDIFWSLGASENTNQLNI